MKSRGVLLLLEAAKLRSEIKFRFLYRQWKSGYTSLAATIRLLKSNAPKNVTLTSNNVTDMSSVYRDHDFTVIPYTIPEGGKECPTSSVEGLACGVPAIISSKAAFAEFVADHKCGVVFDPTPDNLVAAIETGVRQYGALSANAARVARKYFSLENLLKRMTQLYSEVIN
jgi:glycosyltransferase involved in cell wall biosynthesis